MADIEEIVLDSQEIEPDIGESQPDIPEEYLQPVADIEETPKKATGRRSGPETNNLASHAQREWSFKSRLQTTRHNTNLLPLAVICQFPNLVLTMSPSKCCDFFRISSKPSKRGKDSFTRVGSTKIYAQSK